jgi:hypothetical protein
MNDSLLDDIDAASGRLFGLAESVEREGFWKRSFYPPHDKPITADVSDFLHKLLAHVIMTDGHYSPEEHALVKRLTKVDQPFHELRSHLESVREGSPAFFAAVPAFLKAIIAHDRATGRNAAASSVALIEQLADLLARTDEMDDLETAYLVRFIGFLKAGLESAGSQTTPLELDGLGAPRQGRHQSNAALCGSS